MERIVELLLRDNMREALTIALKEYPFEVIERHKRSYAKATMLRVFIRDGFIDRYSGDAFIILAFFDV